MSLDKVQLFAGKNAHLDALSDAIKEKLYGIIFSYRLGVETVAITFSDRSILEELAGAYTKNIPQGSMYYLDLDSIGTDKVRIWVDKRDEDICLYSYYVDQGGSVYEKKEYRFEDGTNNLLIDRFDAQGILLSADEPEAVAESTDWKGDPSIIPIIEEHNLRVRYMKKLLKDQNYVYVKVY